MTTLHVRMEDAVLSRARDVAAAMGLDLDSAIRVFLHQMAAEGALPFRPSAEPRRHDECTATTSEPSPPTGGRGIRLGLLEGRYAVPDDFDAQLPPGNAAC